MPLTIIHEGAFRIARDRLQNYIVTDLGHTDRSVYLQGDDARWFEERMGDYEGSILGLDGCCEDYRDVMV